MPNPDLPAGQLTQNMHLSEERAEPYEGSMRRTSSNSIQGMEKQSSLIMQIKRSNLDQNLPFFTVFYSPLVGLSTKKSRLVQSVTGVLGRDGRLDIPPPTGKTGGVLK